MIPAGVLEHASAVHGVKVLAHAGAQADFLQSRERDLEPRGYGVLGRKYLVRFVVLVF
jgi:hypothetical protein